MSLSEKQQGVLLRMTIGAIITLVLLFAAPHVPFTGADNDTGISSRLVFVLKLELAVAVWLMFSIGLLANHRFFHAEDIDGSGLTAGSGRAKILQANLQNTLEQTVLAVLVHLIWGVYMPATMLPVVAGAVILFVVGRVLFLYGYAKGASGRALGFVLTFYPSVGMAVTMVYVCIKSLGAG